MDMLFTILLVAQVLICITMGGLILVQRSEGGALGMGGGPSGFMSARGAGNLLTTLTGWFAFAFFACSIALTVVGNIQHHTTSALENIDTSKLTVQAPAVPAAPAAAASSSSASGPSLNDLPIITNAPPPQAPQAPQAPVAQTSPAVPLNTAPIKLPSASSSSAAQKDINKAKASIWDNKSAAAPAAKSSASVAPPPSIPVPSTPSSN